MSQATWAKGSHGFSGVPVLRCSLLIWLAITWAKGSHVCRQDQARLLLLETWLRMSLPNQHHADTGLRRRSLSPTTSSVGEQEKSQQVHAFILRMRAQRNRVLAYRVSHRIVPHESTQIIASKSRRQCNRRLTRSVTCNISLQRVSACHTLCRKRAISQTCGLNVDRWNTGLQCEVLPPALFNTLGSMTATPASNSKGAFYRGAIHAPRR